MCLRDRNRDPHHTPSIYLWAQETRKDDITRTGTPALLHLPLCAEEPYPIAGSAVQKEAAMPGVLSFQISPPNLRKAVQPLTRSLSAQSSNHKTVSATCSNFSQG